MTEATSSVRCFRRAAGPALALGGALVVVFGGCGDRAKQVGSAPGVASPGRASPNSSVAQATVTVAPAGEVAALPSGLPAAQPPPSASPASASPWTPETFDVLARRVTLACATTPQDSGGKMDRGSSNYCIHEGLVADRRRAQKLLAPEDPVLRVRLREQEAQWDALAVALEKVVESASSLSLGTGTRWMRSGTADDVSGLSCESDAYLERLYFTRHLGREDARGFSLRVAALAERGQRTEHALDRIRAAATRWGTSTTTVPEGDSGNHTESVEKVEWMSIGALAREIQASARRLAVENCRDIPGVAAVEGGARACPDRVAKYYLGHCRVELAE